MAIKADGPSPFAPGLWEAKGGADATASMVAIYIEVWMDYRRVYRISSGCRNIRLGRGAHPK